MLRLALTSGDATLMRKAMDESSPSETGAFFLLDSGRTVDGVRLVAHSGYFPDPSEWDFQTTHNIAPSAVLISKMVSRARAARAGLLFVHTHPGIGFPAEFSTVDMVALTGLAGTLAELVDGPFAAAVVSPSEWFAVYAAHGELVPIDTITASGRGLQFLRRPDTRDRSDEVDDRQRRALGNVQDSLAAAAIAVVGAGGLGSPLAETLYRMGPRKLALIDPDVLDHPSGVRRVFGTTLTDYKSGSCSKVRRVAAHLQMIGLATEVITVASDVRDAVALPALLDADIVLCGTDSHSSRAYLNEVAYKYNIPVIDAGVRVGRGERGLEGMPIEVRVVGPGLPCLWCMGVLDADRVREENLPAAQRDALRHEGYLADSGEPAASAAALTVTGAGLMAAALLGSLDSEAERLPQRYLVDALFGDARHLPVSRRDRCVCSSYLDR
jgi:hypothetical protein